MFHIRDTCAADVAVFYVVGVTCGYWLSRPYHSTHHHHHHHFFVRPMTSAAVIEIEQQRRREMEGATIVFPEDEWYQCQVQGSWRV